MDWRTLLHPVGPLPRSVYWLRRGALVLVAAAVIAVVVVVVGQLGGSGGTASVTSSTPPPVATSPPPVATSPPATGTTPSGPGSTAATSASAGSTAGSACASSALSVSVKTTDKTVARGADVHVVATLSNSGTACSAAGPLSVVITSGSDRIWASTDCSPASSSTTTSLADHGSASATRTWDLTRSKPGCATVVGDKTANAGTYRVTASWAGATSEPYDFTIE